MIHQAMDAVQREIDSPNDSNMDLIRAFQNRNVLNCIENVHKYLGSQYLDSSKVFKNMKTNRKEDVGSSQCKDLREVNCKLGKCLRERLSGLYLTRGSLHHSQHNYQKAVVDLHQSLAFSSDRKTNYQIYHRLAQAQAKLGRASGERIFYIQQ